MDFRTSDPCCMFFLSLHAFVAILIPVTLNFTWFVIVLLAFAFSFRGLFITAGFKARRALMVRCACSMRVCERRAMSDICGSAAPLLRTATCQLPNSLVSAWPA